MENLGRTLVKPNGRRTANQFSFPMTSIRMTMGEPMAETISHFKVTNPANDDAPRAFAGTQATISPTLGNVQRAAPDGQ
jgi:hypothetical protein